MNKIVLILMTCMGVAMSVTAQNVFNSADPIVRYDATKPLGSAQRPDPAKAGLQKWVSTPTNGISIGTNSWDASSYKAYFLNTAGTPMPYRIKYPRSFNNPDSTNKKYPVFIFLHGASEVGCPSNNGIYNNEKQILIDGKIFGQRVDNNQFDGFLVYPQFPAPAGCFTSWNAVSTQNLLIHLSMVDSMAKYIRADMDRVIVAGLSGGGYGAWRLAALAPQRVAKIIPSAAAGVTTDRNLFVHVPIWFATGGKDPDPTPAQADNTLNRMKEVGADIRYTRYPELGHSVWYPHWAEPDFMAYMNDVHKANPIAFFGRSEFCNNEPIAARLGITQGYYAYEWQREGVTIATRTNGVNTIVQPAHITSYTGNEIIVQSLGTYRVRFKRTAASAWSEFSPKPVVVKIKNITQTPAITINGTNSKVLPARDGNTTVPLQLPAGYLSYEWYRVSDNIKVGDSQIFKAPVGVYKAKCTEQYGCGSLFSPDFEVVNANGTPKPEPATSLTATVLSRTSVRLDWKHGAGETGFEVYSATKPGGPYKFFALRGANHVAWNVAGLNAGTKYYFIMRAVNATGASAPSAEVAVQTLGDNTIPLAPANLQYLGGTQTTASLKWDPVTDPEGIKRYDIYANGAKMFSTTATTFNVFNLDSTKSYAFTVKAVDNNNNESPASNQVTANVTSAGINYKYYTSANFWTMLPDFNALTPVKSGVTDSININNTSIKTDVIKYGFLWEGFIYIPATATYTFETVSDDGTKVFIDAPYSFSGTPLITNDGVHGMVSKTGTITLTQGYHSIAVAYFQGNYGYGMEMYWSNNAGLARQRIPKSYFTFENGANTIPGVPQGLTATAAGHNKIGLTWTDNSTNETNFEIFRSTTAAGTYTAVGRAAANTTTFTDSGLNVTTTYHYKLRAIRETSESDFSNVANAITEALPATPIAPTELEVEAGAGNTISLLWNDNAANENNYLVYRSVTQSKYQLIATLPANSNGYIDAATTALTSYHYYVVGVNASGQSPQSNTVFFKAGNNAPVFSGLANVNVKTNQQAIEDFVITDDAGDALTVSITDRPAFVQLANTGGNNYRITANPTQDNVGWYTLAIVAVDNFGKADTATINITIADDKTKSLFIKLGTKPVAAPWNNWTGTRAANSVISNLKDENNIATTVSLTSVTTWSGLNTIGHITGNNSGIVPDAVLDNGIADNGGAKQFRFAGLNPAMRYNISLVGSMNEGPVATAVCASGTQSATLDSRYNTTKSANLNGLIPDASGQITFTITRSGASAFSYLNAIILEEYTASTPMLNPENLYAEALDRNRIELSWSDRTDGEAAADGYQVQRATDSLFSQNVVNLTLAANTVSYINTGLTPNTKYWYRVRAKNGMAFSGYSNKFNVVTPASIVYVNFNASMPNAASPWNNLQSTPTWNFTFNNLKTQANANSNISVRLMNTFNGEFTAGVVTGNNSGVVPDNVLNSAYWLDNSQLSQFRLSGLNHSRRYRIGFIGSSSSTGWFKGNYTATYTINGRTVYLNSWMNSTKIVYISDIVPNAAGEIFIDFSTTATAQWAFNSGMIIHEYTNTSGSSGLYMSDSQIEEEETLFMDDRNNVVGYPNPFYNTINLEFNNSSASNKIITEVYDMSGRIIARQNHASLLTGRNRLKIHIGDTQQQTGVFLVTLRVNGRIEKTIKMLRGKQ